MQTAIQSGAHALQFQNTHFDVIDRNGVPWLRSAQIAEALGYSQANRITDIYNRHADEFTNDMTAVVKLQDLNPQSAEAGQMREVRIFSPRGCYALGMFSRTPVSATFRKWALDVLEGKISIGSVPPAPTSPTLSDALTLYRESVQALLLTHDKPAAHLLACRSATRITGIDLTDMWQAPPVAGNLSSLPPLPWGSKPKKPAVPSRHEKQLDRLARYLRHPERLAAYSTTYAVSRELIADLLAKGYIARQVLLKRMHCTAAEFNLLIAEGKEAGIVRALDGIEFNYTGTLYVAGGAA